VDLSGLYSYIAEKHTNYVTTNYAVEKSRFLRVWKVQDENNVNKNKK